MANPTTISKQFTTSKNYTSKRSRYVGTGTEKVACKEKPAWCVNKSGQHDNDSKDSSKTALRTSRTRRFSFSISCSLPSSVFAFLSLPLARRPNRSINVAISPIQLKHISHTAAHRFLEHPRATKIGPRNWQLEISGDKITCSARLSEVNPREMAFCSSYRRDNTVIGSTYLIVFPLLVATKFMTVVQLDFGARVAIH